MVIQKAVDNMKDRPKEDKKVVAGGIAIMVVVVIFFVWGIFFLKKIQSGNQTLEIDVGAGSEFLSTSVRDAQADLQNMFTDLDELEVAREQANSQSSDTHGVAQPLGGSNQDEVDPFNTPEDIF